MVTSHSDEDEDDQRPGDQSHGPQRLPDDSQSILPKKKF